MLIPIKFKYFCAVQLLFLNLPVEMALGQGSLETYLDQPATRSQSTEILIIHNRQLDMSPAAKR